MPHGFKCFLDVEKYPTITFKSKDIEVVSENEYKVSGDLTIRGITKTVELHVDYLGQRETPYWVDGEDKGPKLRAGFTATTTINRNDFGTVWNEKMEDGGEIAGSDVHITIDVEAIKE